MSSQESTLSNKNKSNNKLNNNTQKIITTNVKVINKNKEIESNKNKEIESNKKKEVESNKNKEIEYNKKKDIESNKNKEIKSNKNKEIKSLYQIHLNDTSNNIRKSELNKNKEIKSFNQIYLKDNIIEPVYNGSDIISFLSYLNNTICIPQNLRIVCHDDIIQDLLKKLNIDSNDNIKKIFNENLWSIFMSLHSNKKISISTNGFSLLDLIDQKKGKKTIFVPTINYNKLSEPDAKLSLYGILTSLLHGSDLVRKESYDGMKESPDTIFVSILMRTWMTAICLYLPHCKNDNFTLVVSPFLKKKGMSIYNKPDETYQVGMLQYFLEYLIRLCNMEISNNLINENLLKIKNYFIRDKRNLILYSNVDHYAKANKLLQTLYFDTKNVRRTYVYKYYFNESKNQISYNYIKDANYFNKKCNENYEKKIFYIDNIKLFHGETKPFKAKLITSCEYFSQIPKKKKSININECKANLIKNKNQ